MDKALQFVLIGCGRIAQRHAAEIQRVGRLTAVCDIVSERALDLSREYACKNYSSIEELIANEQGRSDIAVICTPNGLHAQQAIACLEAGWHVLCEKPMAIDLPSAEQMIQAARKAGRQLFIVKQNRYNPPVKAVKQLLKEGKLGKLISVQLNCFWNRGPAYYQSPWKGTKAMDGGILYTQFSHFIDIAYWLAGDITEVRSFTGNLLLGNRIEFEDNCVAIVKFSNGAIGTMHFTICSYDKNREGSLTLLGEKGTVKIGGQYLNELEYVCIEGGETITVPKGNPSNQYGFYEGSMSNHGKVYDALGDALNGSGTFLASAEEGLKTVEIIESIYRSSAC